MIYKTLLADKSNFTAGRRGKIQYIVIHYTGNKNDTAAANAKYFTGANRRASAHYFVDDKECYKTVNNGDTAWHCGAASYRHPNCRNFNSIGVEICTKYDGETGYFYFNPATIRNAVQVTKEVMKAYGIPPANVIRHYDVTGKNCPAPYVMQQNINGAFRASGYEAAAWADFKKMITEPD